jgi:cytidylate kinase
MSNFPDCTHSLAAGINERTYARILRETIRRLIDQNIGDFADLVLSLPSVYPASVFEALRELGEELDRAKEIATTVTRLRIGERHPLNNSLPPHPLDYDWRFSTQTIDWLAQRVDSIASNNCTLIGLGTPSLFRNRTFRSSMLLDKNPFAGRGIKAARFQCCNLLKDPLPEIKGDVIVVDPPWYMAEMRAFLWAARKVCSPNATVLVAMPQIGTRPGITRDLKQIANWIARLGFSIAQTELGALEYDSPLFEQLALAAVGVLNYPRSWRHGDLLILRASSPLAVARPRVHQREWSEITIGPVRLRTLKENTGMFRDPALLSLTPGDSPVSISRRDSRKRKAKIWTSSNRVFDSAAPSLVAEIASAIANGKSIVANVEKRLGRRLRESEQSRVQATAKQLKALLAQERREIEHQTLSTRDDRMVARTPAAVLDFAARTSGAQMSADAAVHLAVFVEPFLQLLLEGRKTVESRFSRTRRAPFKQVNPGDIILLKRTGGPVVGKCRVAQVWFYVLDPASWNEVKEFAPSICASPLFWTERANAKYATLIRVTDVERVPMFRIQKRNRLGWLVLKRARQKPSFLIGIAGRPGSGKTTVATKLGAKFGAQVLSFGNFFRALAGAADVQDFGAAYIQSRPAEAVVDALFNFYDVCNTKGVIVEGVRHLAIWHALAERANLAQLVYLHAGPATLKHRLAKRAVRRCVDPNSRFGHAVESEQDKLMSVADHIVVSTTVSESLKSILSQLNLKAA